MHKVVILLTACVNPNGMQKTALQNSSTRLQQYKDALNYYLTSTKVPIVIVENTSTDFSEDYVNYIREGRMEFYTFNGNNYDRTLGKGYGESLIIKYAFNVSNIIKDAKYILKITGRIKVNNIDSLINSCLTFLPNVCRSTFAHNRFIHTSVILIPAIILDKFVRTEGEKCDDSLGFFFEYVLHDFLVKERNVLFLPYIHPPQVDGISGTFNQPYYVPSIKENLHNSLNGTYYFL